MIDKKNIKLTKKFLEYRLHVDQIGDGSMRREKTHLRYVLFWAQETSFIDVSKLRPTLPEYILSNRISDKEGSLSSGYIKKMLATARLFFTWLSDNEAGYKHIKQAWIKTLKVKRLADVPKNKEIVTLDEILAIAACRACAARARRARAAMVFLYLSGMRIGAFVSLPIQAVDIANRSINQFPSLGVRTKNSKHATTFLLDIPELLKVVQDWDDEVRAILPPNGFWFAPLSPRTGEIDANIFDVGIHRINLARRDFQTWLQREGLLYHSPHKFRHGHIHYGLEHAESVAEFKAISLNVMHSDMRITDKFYSVLQDEKIKQTISNLKKSNHPKDKDDLVNLLESVLSELKNNSAKDT